jgi:hypothetical protein
MGRKGKKKIIGWKRNKREGEDMHEEGERRRRYDEGPKMER